MEGEEKKGVWRLWQQRGGKNLALSPRGVQSIASKAVLEQATKNGEGMDLVKCLQCHLRHMFFVNLSLHNMKNKYSY